MAAVNVRHPTPLPVGRLIVVCWMNFSESLSYTMCLPFVPFMVQRFMQLDDDDPRETGWQGASAPASCCSQTPYPLRRPRLLLRDDCEHGIPL